MNNILAANADQNRALKDEDLDAVSGGSLRSFLLGFVKPQTAETSGGQNDPAQMFQQILQQMTQGG